MIKSINNTYKMSLCLFIIYLKNIGTAARILTLYRNLEKTID